VFRLDCNNTSTGGDHYVSIKNGTGSTCELFQNGSVRGTTEGGNNTATLQWSFRLCSASDTPNITLNSSSNISLPTNTTIHGNIL